MADYQGFILFEGRYKSGPYCELFRVIDFKNVTYCEICLVNDMNLFLEYRLGLPFKAKTLMYKVYICEQDSIFVW